MILLSVETVTKHFGPDPVLEGVSFEVRTGERAALIGPNGTGKTTLLKILAGQLDADSGQVNRHPGASIAYLEQQAVFEPGHTLWEEAVTAMAELTALQAEAEQVAHDLSVTQDTDQHERLAARFDRLQHELAHRNAYQLDYQIERVLHGLGFVEAQYRQPVAQLSGGQQNRLMLAKLLLRGADLMLLDEPSNHLDLEATQWLEDFLLDTNQALIVVSHDRYFLDKVTTRTLELFHGTIDDYKGNFSAYWRQKAERLKVQRRTYDKQQEFIAKTKDFIRKHSYGQKHAQAEDRKKKLARLEQVQLPREIDTPVMGFPEAERSGDIVLRAEHLSKSYDQPLFDDLTFQIIRGERWGILGPNGSGKTTLLRCIVGEVEADAGSVHLGAGVKVAYYDQALSAIADDETVVEAVRPDHKQFVEKQRRDLLARFGIKGDMAFQKVSSLSGGERSRAALAKLAAEDGNFLILDEPTNHLDLWARDALERSLKNFGGTVLFVSHDRYFLNQVADHLLVVEPDRFRVIEGNYDTYQHFVREGLAQEATTAAQTDGKKDNGEKPGRRKPSADKPKKKSRRFPYRKISDLEEEIFQREGEVEEIQANLANPETHKDGDLVRNLKAELDSQQAALENLYAHWEEATELDG